MALSGKGIEYGVLQRDANTNRQMFDNLLQRAKETDVSAKLETSNIRVVDKAEVPRRPARPNRTLNLLLALFGGGLFAVGLAFFFEYIDNRIKSPEEIKGYLGLPFLGLVPKLSDDADTDAPLLHTGVPTLFAEAFRNLRTNILFSTTEEGGRSDGRHQHRSGRGQDDGRQQPGRGARAGRPARAAGRRGHAEAEGPHDVQGEPGARALERPGRATPRRARPSGRRPVQNLWLLLAGVAPPNPAELLGSQRFRDFLATLQEHFDWVVVDTPAGDGGHRRVDRGSPVANGVVFVIGCEQTSKHTANAALEQLEAAKAKFLGGVLNKVDVERHSYYYSHYYRRDYGQVRQLEGIASPER